MANYEFSVVLAMRGSRKELNQSIESVLTQEGAEGIQLILAGDPARCPEGAEGAGITLAGCASNETADLWNAGLALAEGEFVTFLCAGNTWAAGAFAAAKAQLGKYPELPLACGRVRRPADKGKFTDPGEFRFKKGEVIEVGEQYQYLLDSVENLFFRRSVLAGLAFDAEAGMAAEALFAYRVLQGAPRYCVAPEAVFCRNLKAPAAIPAEEYEKVLGHAGPAFLEETRAAKAEALGLAEQQGLADPEGFAPQQGLTDPEELAPQQGLTDPEGLTPQQELTDPEELAPQQGLTDMQGSTPQQDLTPQQELTDPEGNSAEAAEAVLPPSARYGQNACAWFVKELLVGKAEGLEPEAAADARLRMKALLQDVEDDVISGVRKAVNAYRVELLKIKHGEEPFDREFVTGKFKAEASILRIEMGAIHLEGPSKVDNAGIHHRVYVKDDRGDRFELARYKAACYDKDCFDGGSALMGMSWWVNLPLSPGRKYKFYLYEAEAGAKHVKVQFGKFTRLSNAMESSYFVEEGMLVTYKGGVIAVKKAAPEAVAAAEEAYCKELTEKGKEALIPVRKQAIALRQSGGKSRRKTWIVSGGPGAAAGNGEALYQYLKNGGAGRKTDLYFAADPKMKPEDRPAGALELGSDEYIARLLNCDILFSSRSDEKAYNPFGADRDYMKDLYRFKTVFMPQEALDKDLPGSYHKTRLNAVLFCCHSRAEWEDVQKEYGYYAREAALTGLPRWDLLDGSPKKAVCFLPAAETFRSREDSAFYRALLTDPKLLAGMAELGYTGVLAAPSEAKAAAAGFAATDLIRVSGNAGERTQLVNENGLLVTERAGADADFAYVHRPVIYAGPGASAAGKRGFGPVCGTVEKAVDAILERLREDCAQPEKYAAREKKAFAFHDKGNARRVLEAVEKLR